MPVEKAARPDAASWSLGYVLEALMSHDAVGDLAAAQRTFREAAPLLAFAEKPPHLEGREPASVARVRFAMGALAMKQDRGSSRRHDRSSNRPRRPSRHYRRSKCSRRSTGSAAIRVNALASLRIGRQGSRLNPRDPGAVADANLAMYEVYRDAGDAASASKSLEAALYRALDAQKLARTGPEQASAERSLARVLEQYGNLDAARRATLRAYEASRSDLHQLTATVLEAGRRGLTHGDLRSSRDPVRRAIDANLGADDLVYVALWLRLLERRLGTPSDGTVEEAFAKIDDDAGWPARLRSWATGHLSDEQLLTAAKNRVEQTEADFYTTMAAYVANDARAAEHLLRIAKSDSIELVEVGIARDLSVDRKRMDLRRCLPELKCRRVRVSSR